MHSLPASDRSAVNALKDRLADVRSRTLELVAGLGDDTLRRQHLPILSPMIWDLGHIADFESQWLADREGRRPARERPYSELFDPTRNPRPSRAELPLPSGEELDGLLSEVRSRSLAAIESADSVRLVYWVELVAAHEEQHQETLLQAMQTLDAPAYEPRRRRELPRANGGNLGEMVRIPGGPFVQGRGAEEFAYDNEMPAHVCDIPAFDIDRFPVTLGEYLSFVEAGGYQDRGCWSEEGRTWLDESDEVAPANWELTESGWGARFMDRKVAVSGSRLPVCHVSYWEADAFARWAGKRLPTESEWEKAALWDPANDAARRFPWGEDPPSCGRANLDQRGFGPAETGAYPDGASAFGVEQMVGDIWEWTSSDFVSYPGFSAHPYPEYSEIFFGDEYKVLRGGSWATRPGVIRGTFRNWDYPIRRQIFAGFRCARDC